MNARTAAVLIAATVAYVAGYHHGIMAHQALPIEQVCAGSTCVSLDDAAALIEADALHRAQMRVIDGWRGRR